MELKLGSKRARDWNLNHASLVHHWGSSEAAQQTQVVIISNIIPNSLFRSLRVSHSHAVAAPGPGPLLQQHRVVTNHLMWRGMATKVRDDGHSKQ